MKIGGFCERSNENNYDDEEFELEFKDEINSEDEEFDLEFDEEGPILHWEEDKNAVIFDISRSKKNLQWKPYMSKSVKYLEEAALTSSPYSSRSSRVSSSTGSIGSLSSVSLSNIKTVITDYQSLLRLATEEIKKLNLTVQKLEQEQEMYIEANDDAEERVATLKEEKDRLESENIELAAENTKLKNNQHNDQLEKDQKFKKEMSLLSLENELLLNNQKFTNDQHEKDLEKLQKELDDEKERVKQLNILNKMVSAENQWLKSNFEDYEKDFENMKKELKDEKEKVKNSISWKFWKHQE